MDLEDPDETEDALEPEPDGTADEYEYVDDSSGLEAPSETDLQLAESMMPRAGAGTNPRRPRR